MPLRIFRIPLLPLKAIFENMEKVEILSFSFCSKRANRMLKVCGKKAISYFNLTVDDIKRMGALNRLELFLLEIGRSDKKVLKEKNIKLNIFLNVWLTMKVNIGNSITFYIQSDSIRNIDRRAGRRRDMTLNGHNKFVAAAPNSMIYTFWRNKDHGLLVLVNYFKKHFKCTIDLSIYAGNEVNQDFQRSFRNIRRYVAQSHVVVRNASVKFKGATLDNDYKYLLKNLKVTGTFGIHGMPSEHFNFNRRCRASKLEISNSPWFTFQHICYGNYIEVDMRSMLFTNEAFNVFLRYWMGGWCPRLKKLQFRTETNIDQWYFPAGWSLRFQFNPQRNRYQFRGRIRGQRVIANIDWNDVSRHLTLEVVS